jgi:chemotaxis protein methyltransferase CheR
MLRIFEEAQSCKIVLDTPIDKDCELLKFHLERNFNSFEIIFSQVYSVNKEIINLLYEQIYQHHKVIKLIVHKYVLYRYLNSLGFHSSFESLLQDEVKRYHTLKAIVIGGSANSSDKILTILSNIDITHITVFIIQHVDPHYRGKFDQIISHQTGHRSAYAKDGETIQKEMVYIAAPDKHLEIKEGRITLSDAPKVNYARPSVSVSYYALAKVYKEHLLVIQECGYAEDGVDTLEYVKKMGALLVIQDPLECEATPMVQNAIAKGCYDFVFKQSDIIDFIVFLQANPKDWIAYGLESLKRRYEYDFTHYSRSLVRRRVVNFMQKYHLQNERDMIGLVLFNLRAFKAIFLDISINVTHFFREQISIKTMMYLMAKDFKKKYSFKVWSAGCSSGEEIYSMAMMLDNLSLLDKSILYATDYNSVVLEEAKNGLYAKEVYNLGRINSDPFLLKNHFESYFNVKKNFVEIDEKLRKKVHFFEHNLANDGSFNEFEIILCQNVIIYFNEALQKKVFQLFYDSLKFGGFLILGSSEMIPPHMQLLFKEYESECKIYQKVA